MGVGVVGGEPSRVPVGMEDQGVDRGDDRGGGFVFVLMFSF